MCTVEAQSWSHTSLIGAHGECLLAITTNSEILCALASSRQVVGVWPFNCLRRYWCGESVFGFEAGKRSPRGEGTFTFATTQDEEIYRMLKRYIDKAKQVSLHGNRHRPVGLAGGTGGVGGGDVENRPKLPLPAESPAHISPAGLSNEDRIPSGEEYAQIPLQDVLVGLPSSTSPLQRRGSLHHTDVSGPNPMYSLKRAQTARPKRIQQWVEQTEAAITAQGREEGGAVGGTNTPPLPVLPRVRKSATMLAEEDMYSHTQHVMPAPFQRHATVHNVVEESTYHTLVHEKCKRRASEGGGGGGEGIYSIAYPSGGDGRQVMIPEAGNEYGTLGSRDAVDFHPSRNGLPSSGSPQPPAEGKKEEEEEERTKEGTKRRDEGEKEERKVTVSTAPKDLISPGFEDSMTENLMYGSRVEVFARGRGQKLEEQVIEEGEEGKRKEGEGEQLVQERPRLLSLEGVSGGAANGGSSEKVNGKSGEGGGGGGGEIQRDAKGYSKVDKSKKKRTEDIGEDAPPPLPPRLYEEPEDDTGLLSHATPPISPVLVSAAVSAALPLPVSDV